MAAKPSVILVNIDAIRDWFVATSDDYKSLMVTHPDLSTLLSDIPAAIKALYKVQHGVDIDITEAGSMDNHNPFPKRYIATTAKAA